MTIRLDTSLVCRGSGTLIPVVQSAKSADGAGLKAQRAKRPVLTSVSENRAKYARRYPGADVAGFPMARAAVDRRGLPLWEIQDIAI